MRPGSIPIILGAAAALAPSGLLLPIAGQEWEVGVLRFGGAFAVAVGLLWPWARRHASWQIRTAAVAGWILAAVYAVTGSDVALVAGFCLVAAVAANLAVGRGLAASEAYAARLEDRRR